MCVVKWVQNIAQLVVVLKLVSLVYFYSCLLKCLYEFCKEYDGFCEMV